MSIGGHLSALWREAANRSTRWILAHRIRANHPSLICDPTAIWDYSFRDIASLTIGKSVWVGAYAEILVYRRSQHSRVEGRLVLGDRSVISTGVNIRAAGGEIRIGNDSGIGQYCVLVAANHMLRPGEKRFHTPWDEVRCGVTIGENVWVGACSVLLPGCRIGDNAVIGAGSVVTGDVPAGELWAGAPARRIKSLETDAPEQV
jgi:acetyltransferase-like isoleucine patch superfamily enzyme